MEINAYQFKIKLATGEYKGARSWDLVKRMRMPGEYSGKKYSVLGVPFGGIFEGRDADGETFSNKTDLWLQDGKSIPVTYYHGFGADEPYTIQDVPVIIGIATFQKMDDEGYWFEVTLDQNEPLADRIAATPQEKLRASSGAIGHLVRKTRQGVISVWPIGELAIFDTNDWRQPANELAVVLAKADSTETQIPAGIEVEVEGNAAKLNSTLSTNPTGELNIMKTLKQWLAENEGKTEADYLEYAKSYVEPEPEPVIDIDALLDAKLEAKLAAMTPNPVIRLTQAPAVIKSLGDPDPKKAFMEYIRTGAKMKGLVSSNLKSNAAALQEGTTTEGGFLVPNQLMPGIVEKRDETSILRKAGATVKQTSRDVADFVSENGSMVEFVITAEEGAVDEDEPTFANPSATIYNMTKLVKVSTQLLEDTDEDLEATIYGMFGRAWGLTENKYFCAGSGSGQPQGIVYGGTAGLTLDSAAYVHAAEVPELYYKLGSQYMDGAGWVMKNATLGLIQALVGDNFQFVPTPAGSMQPMLWSKPVWVSDAMPAATAGLKAIAFGNYAYYGWAERKVMSVQRLNELYAGTGQVGFLATVRAGGVVLQAEAIQYGTMAAS